MSKEKSQDKSSIIHLIDVDDTGENDNENEFSE